MVLRAGPGRIGVRRHEDGIGLWRRLEEALKGDARWYCLAGRADSCQGVCLVVVVSWHMEELAPLKIPTELLHEETVTRHVCIFGVPIARHLLDY